jgi:arginase
MLKILLPEWQGCGTSTEVYDGARALAAALWPEGHDLVVDAPRDEELATIGSVKGLDSIAGRAVQALEALRAKAPTRLTMVGGTCGVELAPVSYCQERYGEDLAVIWLDAHGDLNTPASSPSGHFHGMVLRTLLGDGPAGLTDRLGGHLAPEQVFLVGARDLDEPEHDYIAQGGVTWLGADVCDRPDDLVDAINRGGFSHVYVHFDVDVVDPGDFDSSYFRVPDGPALAAVADTLGTLHRHLDVVGLSVLEYCDRSEKERSRLVTAVRGAQARSCCGS